MLFSFLMPSMTSCDVLRAQRDPELRPALEDEHVVDGLLQEAGVVLAEEGLDLGRGDAALLDGGQLAGLELGQGHDVAVHARDHALDDLGLGGGGDGEANGQQQEL